MAEGNGTRKTDSPAEAGDLSESLALSVLFLPADGYRLVGLCCAVLLADLWRP